MQRLNVKVWFLMLIAALGMESGALFFQYVLDYGPCTLCVQIRAMVFLIMVISIIGLLFKNCNLAQKGLSIAMLPTSLYFGYQSYQVLGVERNWFESSCTLTNAFPAWMPLDEWIPFLFEPWELCGYTPYIIAEITMAEVLSLLAAAYILGAMILIKTAFGSQDQ